MLVPGVAHSALEYYRWALRSQLRADGRRFASELSRTIEAPVLQLQGALDPCLLELTARRSQRWARSYTYRVLDGCGHFPHQEAPDASTSMIAEFAQA
jgi:pimeloyl-ACP methyl ester carboxylesterase